MAPGYGPFRGTGQEPERGSFSKNQGNAVEQIVENHTKSADSPAQSPTRSHFFIREPQAALHVPRPPNPGFEPSSPESSSSLSDMKRGLGPALETPTYDPMTGEHKSRKNSIPDRSPLQKLESTLDDITKAAKRSRMQDAEARIASKNLVLNDLRPQTAGTVETKPMISSSGGSMPRNDTSAPVKTRRRSASVEAADLLARSMTITATSPARKMIRPTTSTEKLTTLPQHLRKVSEPIMSMTDSSVSSEDGRERFNQALNALKVHSTSNLGNDNSTSGIDSGSTRNQNIKQIQQSDASRPYSARKTSTQSANNMQHSQDRPQMSATMSGPDIGLTPDISQFEHAQLSPTVTPDPVQEQQQASQFYSRPGTNVSHGANTKQQILDDRVNAILKSNIASNSVATTRTTAGLPNEPQNATAASTPDARSISSARQQVGRGSIDGATRGTRSRNITPKASQANFNDQSPKPMHKSSFLQTPLSRDQIITGLRNAETAKLDLEDLTIIEDSNRIRQQSDDERARSYRPRIFVNCGPLLRYKGLRTERRSLQDGGKLVEREIWRGSVMIVTADDKSTYSPVPTLRLFSRSPVSPKTDIVNSPSAKRKDLIVGQTKCSRTGSALYIRAVESMPMSADVSMDESDHGLFESSKPVEDENNQQSYVDGESTGKYREVKAAILHQEKGMTFWRFNIEVELGLRQARLAYRINEGVAVPFWVPARGETMNIMFSTCNGFEPGVDTAPFCGPDPLWRDVLNSHAERPFHVMLGGGDQLYNDAVTKETTLFKKWLSIKTAHHKHHAEFTKAMQDELELFYLIRYCTWFSQGLFSVANCQIPMVNLWDDHDIIDGFGSYPHHFQRAPVFVGIGNVAFKYYMLFQHQSIPEETMKDEPSLILGPTFGPYIHQQSRSVFLQLGRKVAFLGLDCRTERSRKQILAQDTYVQIFRRCREEIAIGETKHILVMLTVPIAYPRMNFVENILTSKVMDPIKAIGRTGVLGGLVNKFDGGVEVLDDLNDHWTAKHHKEERNWFLKELQSLAAEKSVRVTFLGGDVHLGAVGRFISPSSFSVPKDEDHRYMLNIISSAIANVPPPDMLADVLNKRNKIHHMDDQTDEDMIPLFKYDVDGKERNNKTLLPRRNYCTIREYLPGSTPSHSPTRRSRSKSRDGNDIDGNTKTDTKEARKYPPGSMSRTTSIVKSSSQASEIIRRLSGSRGRTRPLPDKANNANGDNDVGNSYHDNDKMEDITAANTAANSNPNPKLRPSNQFHRRPTITSERHVSMRESDIGDPDSVIASDDPFAIDLEGGLDISLNFEINAEDPAGKTIPYRLLVPSLFYQGATNTPAPKSRRHSIIDRIRGRSMSRKREVSTSGRAVSRNTERTRSSSVLPAADEKSQQDNHNELANVATQDVAAFKIQRKAIPSTVAPTTSRKPSSASLTPKQSAQTLRKEEPPSGSRDNQDQPKKENFFSNIARRVSTRLHGPGPHLNYISNHGSPNHSAESLTTFLNPSADNKKQSQGDTNQSVRPHVRNHSYDTQPRQQVLSIKTLHDERPSSSRSQDLLPSPPPAGSISARSLSNLPAVLPGPPPGPPPANLPSFVPAKTIQVETRPTSSPAKASPSSAQSRHPKSYGRAYDTMPAGPAVRTVRSSDAAPLPTLSNPTTPSASLVAPPSYFFKPVNNGPTSPIIPSSKDNSPSRSNTDQSPSAYRPFDARARRAPGQQKRRSSESKLPQEDQSPSYSAPKRAWEVYGGEEVARRSQRDSVSNTPTSKSRRWSRGAENNSSGLPGSSRRNSSVATGQGGRNSRKSSVDATIGRKYEDYDSENERKKIERNRGATRKIDDDRNYNRRERRSSRTGGNDRDKDRAYVRRSSDNNIRQQSERNARRSKSRAQSGRRRDDRDRARVDNDDDSEDDRSYSNDSTVSSFRDGRKRRERRITKEYRDEKPNREKSRGRNDERDQRDVMKEKEKEPGWKVWKW